jgi:glycosyltransferase involved in cell wall biosynthesis
MAASKAIICSSNEPMPEFGKDSVLYFKANDIDDLAEKILLLLQDSKLIKKLETSAFNSSKFYDWKLTTQKTIEQMKEI